MTDIEKLQADIDSLKKQRQGFSDQLARIKLNLESLDEINGEKAIKDKLRDKYFHERKEWEEMIKEATRLIDNKEAQLAKMKAKPRR